MNASYDIAIIGAGVVGCAIARELSRYELRTVLIEARSDLGDGASKGNSAVLSTGADTPPGTLECRLVTRGHQRYRDEAPAMGLPIRSIGSLTIAWNESEVATLHALEQDMRAAGFTSGSIVGSDAIYARAPHLAPGACAAIWEPDEAIIDPFSTPFAYALDAVSNGVTFLAEHPVTHAQRRDGIWRLTTPKTEIAAAIVINAAGLGAVRVENLAGYSDFIMRPRRGEFLVFDKNARYLLDVIVKPVPSPISRGVLITPTVFGNILVGPTSEAIDDPEDRRVTREGIESLRAAARRMLPALLDHEITATYCGVRPGTERPEYRISARRDQGWLTFGGIRSTGLSAALGVAEYAVEMLRDVMPSMTRKSAVTAINVPSLASDDLRPWTDTMRNDPAYREIVCFCEGITAGEIRDALASPLRPRSLKALKRRTRAMFGRCQGFFCGARVQAMFDDAARRS
jgi:glycerol-3-phosphate dehydrogenase